MTDENETVVIEMVTDARLRLDSQITGRMEQLGYNPCDYSKLNLGIVLPVNWPADINAQPTLAQLVVVARKLNLRIVISNLNLIPRKEAAEKNRR